MNLQTLQQEPDIRIGIILPEDRYREIRLETPRNGDYQLVFANGRSMGLSPGLPLRVETQNGKLAVFDGDQKLYSGERVHIQPKAAAELAPKSGILVRDVIAGRSFHWKKYIDVHLPGKLELSLRNDTLFLVNVLPFETYLACVATSEMNAACPPALLEAQTIAARSWLLAHAENKHHELGIDACNDDCCQRYQGTGFLTAEAIASTQITRGRVLMYDDEICDARYSKSCGGIMEAYEAVWKGKPKPYLVVKSDAREDFTQQFDLRREDDVQKWLTSHPKSFCSPHVVDESELSRYLGSVDESGRYFRWQVTLRQEELTQRLNEMLKLDVAAVQGMQVLERGGSGRIVRLGIDFLDANMHLHTITLKDQYDIRNVLHRKFLYSSAFIIEAKFGGDAVPREFVLTGGGWGHGVGLCQIGALGMALEGFDTETILQHYYPGSRLETLY